MLHRRSACYNSPVVKNLAQTHVSLYDAIIMSLTVIMQSIKATELKGNCIGDGGSQVELTPSRTGIPTGEMKTEMEVCRPVAEKI